MSVSIRVLAVGERRWMAIILDGVNREYLVACIHLALDRRSYLINLIDA